MATYKTTDEIIKIVEGLLGSISKPKYLKTAPQDLSPLISEYVVINSLPVNNNVMQKCYVNVNYHVKDIGPGKYDYTKLASASQTILSALEGVTASSYLIDFESQETIGEAERGEHYTNMRFSFKYINK